LACPDGHMEDGNDSLSLQVFFDGIEQDQSSVTSQASFGSVGTVLLGILLAGLFFASGSASLAFLKFDRIVGRMAF